MTNKISCANPIRIYTPWRILDYWQLGKPARGVCNFELEVNLSCCTCRSWTDCVWRNRESWTRHCNKTPSFNWCFGLLGWGPYLLTCKPDTTPMIISNMHGGGVQASAPSHLILTDKPIPFLRLLFFKCNVVWLNDRLFLFFLSNRFICGWLRPVSSRSAKQPGWRSPPIVIIVTINVVWLCSLWWCRKESYVLS
jgi:hypothetical protein